MEDNTKQKETEFPELNNETERAKIKQQILDAIEEVDLLQIQEGKASFMMTHVVQIPEDENKNTFAFRAIVIGNSKQIGIGILELYEKYPPVQEAVEREKIMRKIMKNPLMNSLKEAFEAKIKEQSEDTKQKETPENG